MARMRSLRAAGACAVAASAGLPAAATEFGQTHADLAFISVLAGRPLDPGFYVRTDGNYNFSDSLNDQNGNAVRAHAGVLGSFPVKFYASSYAQVFTLAYAPEQRVPFLDAALTTGIYGFYAGSRAEAQTSIFGRISGSGQSVNGFGDFTVVPAAFGWSLPEHDSYVVFAPFDFTAPTGEYDKANSIGNTLGLNYWSWRPALDYTYLNATGQEFSFNAGASVNSQNNATKYRSGDEFYVSYAAQQHLSRAFAFGFEGYYYKQFTDDVRDGRVVNTAPSPSPFASQDPLNQGPGNRGESFAIGPTINYNLTENVFLNLHYVHDVFAFDRSRKEQFWARAVLKF